MRARENTGNISDKRLLTVTEAAIYCGIGKTSLRQWANQIGAVKRFGSRVLFDKAVIDRALDADKEEM